MGNLVNLPNITPESVTGIGINQGKTKTQSVFSTKNYLNTRLAEGETEKELTIRLLPMDLETGNPFVLTHFHNVKVPKEIFGTEWKSYLCLKKNTDIDHDTFGSDCPFCELNKKAYELSKEEKDPLKKKNFVEISIANKSYESVIVRCIERGHEEDGVKFWKFNLRQDKSDPYNEIMKLFNKKLQKSREKGEPDENIFDIFHGRDLIVTIRPGNSAPRIDCDDEITPLSTSEETMREWIYDKKKWQDVFTPKDYDYLTLVAQKKYPWWDKENNKWIDKAEFDARKKNEQTDNEKKVEDADRKLKEDSVQEKPVDKKVEELKKAIVLEDNEEELPF